MTLGRTEFRRKAPPTDPKRRTRKCKVPSCRKEFTPYRSIQPCCSIACEHDWIMEVRAKKERKERQQKLIALKPAKWWKAKAKKAMHLFVRTRDEGKQCCSCDTVLQKVGKLGGDYDAGHLRSVGSAKHLEFDERNVWSQCKYCNHRLCGNPREYEKRLRERIGHDIVDSLMADNTNRHLKINDYQEIEQYYKDKLKQLLKEAQP